MELNKYQELALRTVNKELSKKQLKRHALFGMCGEVGEIQSIFQKKYQGHPLEPEHIKKELGDLLWFVAELATAYDWNLSDIASENIEKLIRRYPEGFEASKSLKRKEGDI